MYVVDKMTQNETECWIGRWLVILNMLVSEGLN